MFMDFMCMITQATSSILNGQPSAPFIVFLHPGCLDSPKDSSMFLTRKVYRIEMVFSFNILGNGDLPPKKAGLLRWEIQGRVFLEETYMMSLHNYLVAHVFSFDRRAGYLSGSRS